jgi:protein SCO1/2
MKIVALVSLLVFTIACSHKSEDAGPVNQYELRGVVVRLYAPKRIAIIKHQKIEGWMDAMTMEFPVKDQSDFDKLQPGLAITAKVFSRPSDYEYWIAEVKPGPTAAAAPAVSPKPSLPEERRY